MLEAPPMVAFAPPPCLDRYPWAPRLQGRLAWQLMQTFPMGKSDLVSDKLVFWEPHSAGYLVALDNSLVP